MPSKGDYGDKVIIYIPANSERRHKTWCIHNFDNYCKCRMQICCGSAHCESYVKKSGVGTLRREEVIGVAHEVCIIPEKQITAAVPQKNNEGKHKTISDWVIAHCATQGEKLLGKVVLIKTNDTKVEFGQVICDDFNTMIIEKDNGKTVKYKKLEAITRNKTVWVLDSHEDLTKNAEGRE